LFKYTKIIFLFLKSPLTGQDHKIRCQPCCRRGVVALRVILERSAYCCGEQIKLNLHLENRQECPTQICVKLIQVIKIFF